MVKHNIINLDKVQSVYNGNLESMVHTEDMDNASFVHVGGLNKGERELKDVKIPTAESIKTDSIVVIASDEVIKDNRVSYSLSEFYNKANEPMKAYHLIVGDILTVTKTAIEGEPVVGKFLVPTATSTKLTVADDLLGGTRFVAEILDITEKLGYENLDAVVLQIKAN